MKLSRKAKKRLIVLGVMLSPVFLLLVIYLAHLNEPGEYTILKKELSSIESSVDKQETITYEQPKLPEQYELSKIYPYALMNAILKQVPQLNGIYANETPNKEDIISSIQSNQPFSKIKSYKSESELTSKGVAEFHELCDEVESVFLSDSDRSLKEINRLLVEKHIFYPVFIKFTIIRASFSGEHDKARSLFDRLLEMNSCQERNQIQIDISNLLSINFLWWCCDVGILDEYRIESLKQSWIKKYIIFRDSDVFPPRYVERNSEIIRNCEEYCLYIQQEQISNRNNSMVIFLESNLGGLPLRAWNGMMEPVRIHRAKKLAIAMTHDDPNTIYQAKKQLAMVTYGMNDGGFSDVSSSRFGIYLPIVMEKFPWYRTDGTDIMLNDYFGKIAFLEMLEKKEQTGNYPTGYLTIEAIKGPIEGFHEALVIYPEEMRGALVVHNEKWEEIQRSEFHIPPRPVFLSTYSDPYFESEDGTVYNIAQINSLCQRDETNIQQIKTEKPLNINYEWTASNWQEAEPVLRDILVDQRPGK